MKLIGKFFCSSLIVGSMLAMPVFSAGAKNTTTATWNDVSAYINAHAISITNKADSHLKGEVLSHVQTWVTFTGSEKSLNGPGLGWPSAQQNICFSTLAETNYCASLIVDATFNAPADARSR